MTSLSDILGVERFSFLHIKNNELQSFKKTPGIYSDETVKNSFDHFFTEVNNWRNEFNTEVLSDFWAIGVDYDGYLPGLNRSFLGLYQELMNIAINPLSYQKGYSYNDIFPEEES